MTRAPPKLRVGLNACPVGAGLMPLAGSPPGTPTTRGTGVTVAPPGPMEYRVAVAVPLFATHSGDDGLRARPQGFLRLGSTMLAPTVDRSETRLVWWTLVPPATPSPPAPCAAAAAQTGAAARIPIMPAVNATMPTRPGAVRPPFLPRTGADRAAIATSLLDWSGRFAAPRWLLRRLGLKGFSYPTGFWSRAHPLAARSGSVHTPFAVRPPGPAAGEGSGDPHVLSGPNRHTPLV